MIIFKNCSKRELDKNQLKSNVEGSRGRERDRLPFCVVRIDGIRRMVNDLNYNAFAHSKLSNFVEDNLIADNSSAWSLKNKSIK